MWKQKTGISVSNSYGVPVPELVRLVGRTGFDAVSPEWEENDDFAETAEAARESGLAIQSLHGPFDVAAKMWSADTDDSEEALRKLLLSLETCKQYSIPVMVVHVWMGFDNIPAPNSEGFENFGKLVKKAEEYGVKIAFENTEGDELLFALMEHFDGNGNVGFCWDSGHEMCYNHSMDLLARFGDRLIMTHLNDNLGISRFDGKTYWTDDLHLLPFDGIADWDYNVARMKKAKKQEYINFELNIRSKPNRHENDAYGEMPIERYFTEAYNRACRIAYKMAQTDNGCF
jgi:L-ribulose-5-phosphate 3-epimerase